MVLRQSSSRRHAPIRLDRIVWTLIVAAGSFYGGILVGIHSKHPQQHNWNNKEAKVQLDQRVRQKVQTILRKRQELDEENNNRNNNVVDSSQLLRFGEATAHFALGAARIQKQDFVDTFDGGFPSDNQGKNVDPAAQEVLIFYNQHSALPGMRREEIMSSGSGIPPKLTAMDATQNCEILHVVSTKSAMQQCVALVPQQESFHVQRWMRLDNNNDGMVVAAGVSRELPLLPVGRGQQGNGVNQFETPSQRAVEINWTQLQTYLESLSSTLEKLKPLLQQVAANNTVVAMVCNQGQSDLLTNFACSNKARGLSLENILIFCTDQETCDIATGLGMAAYYDEKNFAKISSSEAKEYGDKTFQDMMYAKVVAVQLVNWLGYDVLFQDVDVVWFQNPLGELQRLHPSFDVLVQDDGAQSVRYKPFQANSGFYYARHNERTRYLLVRMLYAGDTIVTCASHQQALNALLAEHASLYGLRVKTLEADDFPGGFHFHRRSEFMRDMIAKTRSPFSFHMSWTKNKNHKIKFLQQMGWWYVSEDGSCLAEPLVSCHYRDKPSVRPCPDSPPLDKGGKSFWT